MKINISSFQLNSYVLLSIKRVNTDHFQSENEFPELSIDTTSSNPTEQYPFCYTRGKVKGMESDMSFPVTETLNDYVYVYFSIEGSATVNFEVTVTDKGIDKKVSQFHVSKDMTNEMYFNYNR